MHKMMLAIGLGTGYVLGAKAGRERYDQLHERWDVVAQHPTVQAQTHAAQQKANEVYAAAKTRVVAKLPTSLQPFVPVTQEAGSRQQETPRT